MLGLAFKAIAMFTIGIIIMRVMGKSAISQLTPYDLVAIITIGTVIAEPLISIELKPTLFVLLILTVSYMVYSKLSLIQVFNKLLLGEPAILIKHGKIVNRNIIKERVSLIQLTSILRASGYPKLEDIQYAILEPTGEISVIPKSKVRVVTTADLSIKTEYEGLPMAVIIDGKIQRKNLELISKDKNWLKNKLGEEKISDIKDVVYAYAVDGKDEVYISLRSS